jgi:hypothetical protein
MSDQLSILSEARRWPEKVVADWRRFSSGLWRVSEGDIQAAYSAEIFPNVKVFTHNGVILTYGGGFFSEPVAAAANCYPLIPADEYRGPEPCRYTYEACEACYRGEVFKLGPKIVFVATDATVDEWRGLLRSVYADGGWPENLRLKNNRLKRNVFETVGACWIYQAVLESQKRIE